MEEKIVQRNPYLKRIFTESEVLYDAPVIIAQISFDKKQQVEEHVLMIGDAAGMITPLCGNGMSMALHASKVAFEKLNEFLKGKITREMLELQYQDKWNELFEKRLHTGRLVQSLFGKRWLTNAFIQTLKPFPGLIDKLIRKTHGTPF